LFLTTRANLRKNQQSSSASTSPRSGVGDFHGQLNCNSESLVENAGFDHVFLPSCIYHYLLVNDNNAHGVAKARWRAVDVDHSDDVASPLALMMCLDQVEKEHISHWFIRNYLLDQNNIQIQYISALLGRPSADSQ